MKQSSIKFKLLLMVSIGVMVSFIILGINTAMEEFNVEYDNVKKEEMLLTQKGAKFIDAFLQSKMDIIEAYAKEISLENGVHGKNKKLMYDFNMGKKAGKFADFYIALEEDGSILLVSKGYRLTKEKDNYDARIKPWYIEAKSRNKVGVSAPYVDFTTKKLVVSVCAPIIRDGKYIGILGSDISIETIVNTISDIKLRETGYSYLVNKDSQIFVHKNKKLLNKKDKLFGKIKTGGGRLFV